MRVVILDNYDSFAWNLYQGIGELGAHPVVHRNDAITIEELKRLAPDRIVLSPGPGRPEEAACFGVCAEAISQFGPDIPILGVCLGHLGIISGLGGKIIRAPAPRHGKTSTITHDNKSIYRGLPPRIDVMRYHSLIGDESTLPECLQITARTADGLLMGVRHRRWPLEGVQFHPESICTPDGSTILKTFLENNRI